MELHVKEEMYEISRTNDGYIEVCTSGNPLMFSDDEPLDRCLSTILFDADLNQFHWRMACISFVLSSNGNIR